MILTKLTFHNFGIYAGRHEIDVAPKPDRPIALFGALNGSGKTTLLEGIQFGLFGKGAKFLGRGKAAYVDFLANSINRRTLQSSASVGVEFSTRRRGRAQRYEVVRTWSLKGSGAAEDEVQVFKNGELDEELSQRWDELSETFFPSQLSDLFFFDGERIEELAEPNRCSELIKTGLNSLLGLDLVTDLRKTLTTLDRRLKLDGVDEGQRQRLERLIDKHKILTEQETGVLTDLSAVMESVQELDLNLQRLRFDLAQQGGELYIRREELRAKQGELSARLQEKRAELIELSASGLPLALVGHLLTDLESYAREGLTSGQREAVLEAIKSFSAVILSEVRSRALFSEDQLKTLSALHEAHLSTELSNNSKPDYSVSLQALAQAKSEQNIQRAGATKSLLELNKILIELDQIERTLLAVPDGDKLSPLLTEITEKETSLAKRTLEADALRAQLARIQRDLDGINTQIDSMSEKQRQQDSEIKRLEKMRIQLIRGKEVLHQFEEKIRNKHIAELEKLVLRAFQTLLRKKAFVKSIAIDHSTYQLKLYIEGEGVVPASKLSAGERQVLAVAVLWALSQKSGKQLPTVIDTPLGRLDSNHRKDFVELYFPNASDQVILLSTDEEIVGRYYRSLRKHLAHEYLIEYDDKKQSSAVAKGYFDNYKEAA
jgi:DNA sulfur modification protein DndD